MVRLGEEQSERCHNFDAHQLAARAAMGNSDTVMTF
jgi:hypothetical protein